MKWIILSQLLRMDITQRTGEPGRDTRRGVQPGKTAVPARCAIKTVLI